jgi:hypothetical protein
MALASGIDLNRHRAGGSGSVGIQRGGNVSIDYTDMVIFFKILDGTLD